MTIHTTPQAAVEALLANPVLPQGDDERFVGFGVMGLPFGSGHYLALRHFPAASFAPAYLSVWHRDPNGDWTFYATTPAAHSCSRYFGSATTNDAVRCDIEFTWATPWWFRVEIPGLLDWSVHMTTTFATRLMTALGGRLPEATWTNAAMLAAIGRCAGPMLGAGSVRLAGVAPNGQHFMIAPKTVWAVSASRAVLGGEDLGPLGPLPSQARLAGFRAPQRGMCVIGTGHFENYDVRRHDAVGATVSIGSTR